MRKFAFIALAVIVIALVLVLVVPKAVQTEDPVKLADTYSQVPDDWEHVIAYVPLDDRTDNIDNVIYLAEASGYRVVMPETDLIHTSLDGQEPNSNGTQYGDREAIFTWIRDMDERGCDLFLLSLDQLMSGGLVNSRALSGSLPLEFDDGTLMSETEAFDSFVMALGEDPDNRVYMFDSVVRLASTVGYQGFDLEEYNATRAYGMVARPQLSGDELTPENIFAAYKFGADGKTPAVEYVEDESLRALLTDEVVENYFAARERKLNLLDHAIKALKTADTERFKLLVGIDDSTDTINIQSNELSYITQSMGENASLIAGLDCLARLLVGSIAQDEYDYSIKAYVEYIGGSEAAPPSDYDSYSLESVVDLNMEFFGAEYVQEADAELQIVIMTKPDDESLKQEYCDELIAKLKDNEAKHIPTVLIESSNNAYGKMLEDAIVGNVELAQLMGFSGKYYQANVIGSGFAMGVSRYLYLRCCDDKNILCDEAQLRQLTLMTQMSYAFAINSREPLISYVGRLGYNHNNIIWSDLGKSLILGKTEKLMQSNGEAILENLQGGSLPCELEPYTTRQVEAVSMSDFCLPWNRTFEITFKIEAALK